MLTGHKRELHESPIPPTTAAQSTNHKSLNYSLYRPLWLTHLKEEAKADPLVVFVLLPVNDLALAVADARVGHLAADLLLEEALERVRGMYPAVCVQHVLRYVFGVYTVYRIAHVLAGGDDQRERHEYHDGDRVVQSEDGRVYGNVADFDEGLEAAEYVQHVGGGAPAMRVVLLLLWLVLAAAQGHETGTIAEFVQQRGRLGLTFG